MKCTIPYAYNTFGDRYTFKPAANSKGHSRYICNTFGNRNGFNSGVMLSKPEHSLKAYSPILVTLSGIVMLVRLLQLEKVKSSILVTPSGIAMLIKLLQL